MLSLFYFFSLLTSRHMQDIQRPLALAAGSLPGLYRRGLMRGSGDLQGLQGTTLGSQLGQSEGAVGRKRW